MCVIAAPWAARAAAATAGSRDPAARGSVTEGTEGSGKGAARSHLDGQSDRVSDAGAG